jgi:hypothetical protein
LRTGWREFIARNILVITKEIHRRGAESAKNKGKLLQSPIVPSASFRPMQSRSCFVLAFLFLPVPGAPTLNTSRKKHAPSINRAQMDKNSFN